MISGHYGMLITGILELCQAVSIVWTAGALLVSLDSWDSNDVINEDDVTDKDDVTVVDGAIYVDCVTIVDGATFVDCVTVVDVVSFKMVFGPADTAGCGVGSSVEYRTSVFIFLGGGSTLCTFLRCNLRLPLDFGR